ncbi:MAG: DNA-directed RNA polymerase subunit beta, partial [Planctomycetes bacterium]|nr:DNA-directed RNA polymerase subunit beta [Planctomycetota bacterium]
MQVRNFGKVREVIDVPNLMDIQRKSYAEFLQEDVPPAERKNQGLEAILRETFPIKNLDGSLSLEYLRYELGKPRYRPEECRRLRLTYGRPLRLWVRLAKAQPVEEDVYIGEMPIMIGGGEFVVNGAERVIVAQLHRSPGIDFIEEVEGPEKKLQSFRIIPERGSWVEASVTRKDVLVVRVDQSGKIPISCFLRAISEDFSADADIIRLFYETESVKVSAVGKLRDRYVVGEVVDKASGEVIL